MSLLTGLERRRGISRLHRKEGIANTNLYQSLHHTAEVKLELDYGVTWYSAGGAVILVQKPTLTNAYSI